MDLDLFEMECRTPLLGTIDPGKKGFIIKNDEHGVLEAHKTPLDDSGGIDITAYVGLLTGLDFILVEHVPMIVAGPSRVSEESCHCQYMQLYGMLETMGSLGLIKEGFYTIKPGQWQDFLGFPKKSVATGSIYHKSTHGHLPAKEQNALKAKAQVAWKEFFLDQARMKFPHSRIVKDAAESYLLYDVLRKLWAIPREDWP